MIKKIILVSTSVWAERVWTNKQQIAKRLSERGFEVIYVEPPGPFISVWFKNRRLKAELNTELNPNLKILTSLPAFPFPHKFPPSDVLNFWMVAKRLRKIANKNNFYPFILWIYTPLAWPLVGKLGEAISCYDCVDDYSAFPGAWARVINYYERRLLEKTDIVFVTSRALYESKSRFHPDVHYVPNVADYELFSTARDPNLSFPEQLKGVSRPILGFVGTFNYKLDIKILEHLAKRGYSIVIVGPIARDKDMLANYKNLIFVGKKEPYELPRFLKAFDVCIIPYVVDKYTESVLPLKLFEYFASGKPVVSTAFGEMKNYEHLVELASSPVEFEQAILRALNEPQSRAELRIEEAKKHTWDERIGTMLNLLEKKLEAKKSGT